MEQFFVAPDSTQLEAYNNARAALDFYLLKTDLSKDNSDITFTYSSPEYLDETAAKDLAPFVKKALVYVWKEGRFTLKM